MKQILLAVDETEASRRAAEFVERFFAGMDVSVTALNVAQVPIGWMAAAGYTWGPVPFGGVTPWPVGPRSTATREERLSAEEQHARAAAADQAPPGADVEVVIGDAVEAIAEVAEERDVDLIVVGSEEKGFLQRWLGHSVSQDLAKDPPRPVLVVG